MIFQNLSQVHEYYGTLRTVNGELETIYQIWERGEAFDDSVTPSTYCPYYRNHMLSKLRSLTSPGQTLLSLGCGNAVLEAYLVAEERSVIGVDCNAQAVSLARQKGLTAMEADFLAMESSTLDPIDLVYADGFVGHLFTLDGQLREVLAKIRSLPLRPMAKVLISNDAPLDAGLDSQPHNSLSDFWFLSHRMVAQNLANSGFIIDEAYTFPYLRPKSGMRNRTICIASLA
jgi:hypothetical protein